MPRSGVAREILTPPDSLGRVSYIERWDDPAAPYCGACGRENCQHRGTPAYSARGQVFFGVPER